MIIEEDGKLKFKVSTPFNAIADGIWQPIETAPKDGTKIIISDGVDIAIGSFEFGVLDAGYDIGGEAYMNYLGDNLMWMSSPTLPVIPKSEREEIQEEVYNEET